MCQLYNHENIFSYTITVYLSISGNLTLIKYFYSIYSPHSNFISCPSKVLTEFSPSNTGSSPKLHIAFSCCVS